MGFLPYHFSVSGVDTYIWLPPLVAFLISALTSTGGIYGIGGGALLSPILVSFLVLPVYTIAGAVLAVNFITSLAGVFIYTSIPLIDGQASPPDRHLEVLLGAGGLCGMYLEARLQRFLPEKGIRVIRATITLTVACKYILQVFKKPRVAIVATGDEIVLPGTPLKAGQLYASNAVTLEAWCRRIGCETALTIVPDLPDALVAALRDATATSDAVLTSGGAWSGERDLVSKSLDELEWQKIFHRVRLGPGKATGMGRVGQTPVFILPGGPPSNLIGFLKLALPGLLKLGGHSMLGLPQRNVRLAESVQGLPNWTQAVFGSLRCDREGRWDFQPDRQTSRLMAMGNAEALLTIPEGVERFSAGTHVTVGLLI